MTKFNGVDLVRHEGITVLVFESPALRKRIGELLATGPETMTRIAIGDDDATEAEIRSALDAARDLYPLPPGAEPTLIDIALPAEPTDGN